MKAQVSKSGEPEEGRGHQYSETNGLVEDIKGGTRSSSRGHYRQRPSAEEGDATDWTVKMKRLLRNVAL
jgi:hypothetical protein